MSAHIDIFFNDWARGVQQRLAVVEVTPKGNGIRTLEWLKPALPDGSYWSTSEPHDAAECLVVDELLPMKSLGSPTRDGDA